MLPVLDQAIISRYCWALISNPAQQAGRGYAQLVPGRPALLGSKISS
jgi:hypothetical protein